MRGAAARVTTAGALVLLMQLVDLLDLVLMLVLVL